ncbi:MAG: hypothetical protein A3E01_01570 [Gammaproteobacteria bacterium RIFCSPHIGHO2_12_FULL_63_22]|nr:MAG: hypothetical protein A3E01_01570 [Gammaproteobacteria bacterium RIFCSPHIGHO2_12_FULL_63_22]
MFRTSMRALACASLLAMSSNVSAQATSTLPPGQLEIPRVEGAISLDGALDEPVWQQAAQIDLAYEVDPADNTLAPVKTTAYIAYAEDALLIGFRAEDPDPGRIRAFLRDRDALYADDYVGLLLDTFDDGRRAYEFFVNPLGIQADLIREEATGDEDDSWDGIWSSAGRMHAHGYDVEIRIPFATLRFADTAQARRWSATFRRVRPREFRAEYSSNRMERGAACMQCTFTKLDGFSGIRQGSNLEIAPTLALGLSQSRAAPRSPWQDGETAVEAGVDVSWAPSPNMTLNATVNPDFSQVESDQLQLNLNDNFALFSQEKRPFFLEGSDYFNTQFNVLYTRQIAEPDFGLRVTGRSGVQTYGAIVARDATTLVLVPGVLGSSFIELSQTANVAVGRYRHDVNEHASVGVIGTFRAGNEYANNVAGVDARWQSGVHTATAQFLHSQSEYPDSVVDVYRTELGDDATPAGSAWRGNYGFSSRNWKFDVSHTNIDAGFRADLGFMGQVGYDQTIVGGGYSWYRDGKSINRVTVYADWDITYRFDGQLLERELEFSVSFQGPKQSRFGFSPRTHVRYWQGAMFNEHNLNLFGVFRPFANLQLGVNMNFGQQLDLGAAKTGRRAQLGFWGSANIGRGLSLDWDISNPRLRREGGDAVDAVVLNTGGSWQLDPRQRLRLTLQGSELRRFDELADRNYAAQLVYSYKINPRTALYAGGSYGAMLDIDTQELYGNSRNVFLKLSYGWQPVL